MLDLQRLRALHAVSVHGSVGAAAIALGYTPSAVSQQIAKLERETRTTLLERQGRGVALTDEAQSSGRHRTGAARDRGAGGDRRWRSGAGCRPGG